MAWKHHDRKRGEVIGLNVGTNQSSERMKQQDSVAPWREHGEEIERRREHHTNAHVDIEGNGKDTRILFIDGLG